MASPLADFPQEGKREQMKRFLEDCVGMTGGGWDLKAALSVTGYEAFPRVPAEKSPSSLSEFENFSMNLSILESGTNDKDARSEVPDVDPGYDGDINVKPTASPKCSVSVRSLERKASVVFSEEEGCNHDNVQLIPGEADSVISQKLSRRPASSRTRRTMQSPRFKRGNRAPQRRPDGFTRRQLPPSSPNRDAFDSDKENWRGDADEDKFSEIRAPSSALKTRYQGLNMSPRRSPTDWALSPSKLSVKTLNKACRSTSFSDWLSRDVKKESFTSKSPGNQVDSIKQWNCDVQTTSGSISCELSPKIRSPSRLQQQLREVEWEDIPTNADQDPFKLNGVHDEHFDSLARERHRRYQKLQGTASKQLISRPKSSFNPFHRALRRVKIAGLNVTREISNISSFLFKTPKLFRSRGWQAI
ncbi:hypothetical protein CLOM_g799 [Closterium sp. NIES-68]|nr:hypothetical protein CLOM_g799 [Closterium sp. NIES-68]GJP64127.1 hypothetical protein CLOP_g21148 [Closterium sp. NIES-67]